MFSKHRVAGNAVVSTAAVGVIAGVTLGALHPSVAGTALAAVTGAVACGTTTACVSGSNSGAGPGVSGTSAKGAAITASGIVGISATGTAYGVKGTSVIPAGQVGPAVGAGVAGSSPNDFGVWGLSTTNFGVYGSSSGNEGVMGSTTSTAPYHAGVFGTSSNGYGVHGYAVGTASSAGVYGTADCCYGVYGSTTYGGFTGVRGTADSGAGVYGDSATGVGVYGSAQSGAAVEASAGSGVAVQAISNSNAALSASTTGGVVAIYGSAPHGNGAEISGANIGLVGRSDNVPLYLSTLNGALVFYVDGSGNVFYHGGLHALVRAAGGATATTFSPNATQPTIEDTGSAQLVGGSAAVRLDPAFAASIDAAGGYHVFLTANGETRGSLYVPVKTAAGFIVRETQGGRSTVSFDYRIVATSLGANGRRMALTMGALPPGTPSAPLTVLPIKAAPVQRPLPVRPAPKPAALP
jgi:hypothetical protein